jgi:hypothetical protein
MIKRQIMKSSEESGGGLFNRISLDIRNSKMVIESASSINNENYLDSDSSID